MPLRPRLSRWPWHYAGTTVPRCRAPPPLLPSRRLTTAPASKPKVDVYVSKVTDPWINLAFEEWLFRKPDSADHVLYLWRNTKCVVVGRNQNPWKECHLELMQQENVPLVRRRSGGGTVYHDIGNTNYTIIMPRETFDRRTNAELVVRSLHQLDVPASVNTRHDIVVTDDIDGVDKKVSGSAYKLVNTRAYHHGTMLIDADLGALGRYLRPPPKNLVGKGVESVRSTVGRLRDYSYTVDHLSFCEEVAAEFCRSHGADAKPPIELTASDLDRDPKIRQYHDEITTWDWIYGQTPDFTHRLEQRFGWGAVDIILKVHRGIIVEAAVSFADAPALVAVAMRLAERLKDKQYSRAGLAAAFAFDGAQLGTERTGRCMQELAGWLGGAL
ncbi:hypothetical protein HDU90_004353 [Geranomyces variabilis]|nr:hypothetical protein HDU90_004353 [Geranomyces variabilis]